MDICGRNYPACLSQTLIKKYAVTLKATVRIMSLSCLSRVKLLHHGTCWMGYDAVPDVNTIYSHCFYKYLLDFLK